jgi:hypothetical protein
MIFTMKRLLIACCLGWALASAAWSAEPPTAPATTAVADDASTLHYFNRPVFTFRGALSGVSASDRTTRATAPPPHNP